jgi:hypothetical protein
LASGIEPGSRERDSRAWDSRVMECKQEMDSSMSLYSRDGEDLDSRDSASVMGSKEVTHIRHCSKETADSNYFLRMLFLW